MENINFLYFSILLLCLSKYAIAQDMQHNKFVVVDSVENTAIADASITIYAAGIKIDQQITNKFGEVNLKLNRQSIYFIRISHVAYTTKDFTFTPTKHRGNLTIELQKKSRQLAPIDITGITTRYEPDKTSYLVNQKLFSASDNAIDVLKRTPSISVINSEVSVLGQKNVAYFYNGKEVDFNFIKLLQSKSIKKIEVKDVKYKEGQFIIIDIISTKLLDGYALTLGQSLGTRNRAGSEINAKIKKQGLVVDANLQFHRYKNEGSHMSQIELQNNNTKLLYDGERTNNFKNLVFSTNIAYEIDSMHTLSFYLNKLNSPTKNSIKTDQIIQESRKTTWSDNQAKFDQLTSNLEYKKKFNKQSELITSLYFKNENQIDSFQIIQDAVLKNKYFITKKEFIVQVDYAFNVGSPFSYSVGSKYVHRNNNNKYSYDLDFENQHQEEDIFQLLTEVISKNRWVNAVAAMQMEFYKGNLKSDKEQSRAINYHNLLYSIILSKSFNNKNNFRLNIARLIYRPSMHMLSLFYNNQDINAIRVGNDKLKPETHNILRLSYSTTFPSFDLNISNTLNITKNEINTFFIEKDNSTIREFINMDRKLTYRPAIDLSYTNGNWYNQLGLSYSLFKFKGIDALISNPSKNFNSLSMHYSTNYTFKKTWDLDANLLYESDINSFQTKMKGYIYGDVSLAKRFKNLRVSLTYTDAFNRASNFINTLYLTNIQHQKTLYNANVLSAKITYAFGKDFKVNQASKIKNDDIKHIN